NQIQNNITKNTKLLLNNKPITNNHTNYPTTILNNIKPNIPTYKKKLFNPTTTILHIHNNTKTLHITNNTTFNLKNNI
ncbi:aldehyde dehydrogenase family protein, partial [Xanthomonas citri pv. citri]|nr:aldehyde dehydrogenase family protein [Xanthomonas citri pv. citri]